MKYNKHIQQVGEFAFVLYAIALSMFILSFITRMSAFTLIGWIFLVSAMITTYVVLPNLKKEKSLTFSDYWKNFSVWLDSTWKKFIIWLHT